MHQMYIVGPKVKGGMHYIRVGLIYKPHGLFAGYVKRCATFLRTFFNRCESEIDVAPSQSYFLYKRRGVEPLCCPMPSWICVNTLIPCPGVVDKEGADCDHWCSFFANNHFQNDDHNNSLLLWHQGEGTCIHTTGVQAPQRH